MTLNPIKREEKARNTEAEIYGIVLGDIKKEHGDNRVFLCFVRGILVFLAVYGTIVGLAASFELPFSVPLVALTLLVISLFSAFIYYNRVTFYTGYVIVFLLLIIMAFAFYLYINSGFQAFLNEVIDKYETFFGLATGRVAEEQITDRTATVSAMLIFVGGVFSIFFNITISGYMDLPVTFLVSFLPLQFAFYIDLVPPVPYLVMLLSVYISVAVLGRSGHFTLPYRYKKDLPFGRKRRKSRQEHFYQASGQGMLTLSVYSLLLSTAVMLIVGGVFSAEFSTKRVSNAIKDRTDNYVKTVVVGGITALFNRYDAVGGLAKGQLGGVRSVSPDYETDLIVDFVPYGSDNIYLKGYTGVRYENNRFYDSFQGMSAKAVVAADGYGPVAADGRVYYAKMRVENVGADENYDYQPYFPFLTTDAYAGEQKTGVPPMRTSYLTGESDAVTLENFLPENTYETLYLPYAPATYYRENPSTEQEITYYNLNTNVKGDYDLFVHNLYLFYPTALKETLAAICDEAHLSEIAADEAVVLPDSSDELLSDDLVSLFASSQSVSDGEVRYAFKQMKTLAIAGRLKEFYQTEFRYTMMPGATPYGEDTISYFLTKDRRGYCAHFAASSALILRYLGIPTRYCEGYLLKMSDVTDDNRLSDGTDGWLSEGVSTSVDGVYEIELPDANAHAWVEIYLDGYGWIPYEMTPPSYEQPLPQGAGLAGFFAGLFRPTERVVDADSSGRNLADDAENGGLFGNNGQLADALNNATDAASQSRFSRIMGSVGYLFLPFFWMLGALLVVFGAWYLARFGMYEYRRLRLLRDGRYGDALLLEYRRALKAWQKKGIVKEKNPSVRAVGVALRDANADERAEAATSAGDGARKKALLSEEELETLLETVHRAGFAADGISRREYESCREMLKMKLN